MPIPTTPNTGSTAPLLRSGLYGLKPAFVSRLRRVEDVVAARGISADAVTVAGICAGLATAAVLALGVWRPVAWLAVAPLCLLRMACNALDGSLARRQDATSARGAVLNELGDRVADLATFTALAPAVGAALALATALVALSTSFVAVVGAAVVGNRLTSGPLGKPDRVAVLGVAATAAALVGPAALVVGAWAIVAAGLLTVARRTGALWRYAGGAS